MASVSANTAITFLELFVLPTLAAWLAGILTSSQIPHKAIRIVILLLPALACAYLTQHLHKLLSRPPYVTSGDNLSFEYGPAKRQLLLQQTVVLVSGSDEELMLQDISGDLHGGNGLTHFEVPVAASEVSCTSGRVIAIDPFLVSPTNPLRLDCTSKLTLTQDEASHLLSGGKKEFSLRFVSKEGEVLSTQLCFDISDQLAEEIAAEKYARKRFIDARC